MVYHPTGADFCGVVAATVAAVLYLVLRVLFEKPNKDDRKGGAF